MSSRFRASKYRHVFGTAYKAEETYPDLQVEASSEGDGVACSTSHLAVASGKSVVVLPLGATGKRKQRGVESRLQGHSGQVHDLHFSPFHARLLASAADDGTVRLWQVPDVSDGADGGAGAGAGGSSSSSSSSSSPTAVASSSTLQLHSKRVARAVWHPSASHVLASAGGDGKVGVWDVSRAQAAVVLAAQEATATSGVASSTSNGAAWTDVAWSCDGALLAGVQGGRIAVLDPRTAGLVQEGAGHAGQKAQRLAWLGAMHRLVTTGFSQHRDRQVFVWDSRRLQEPLKRSNLDSSTGLLQPLYDADAQLLFLAGRGDNSVRVWDMQEASPHQADLATFSHPAPAKGMALAPKLGLRTAECEVARLLKLTASSVVPLGFRVPRKAKRQFAADLYPDTPGPEPALTASQYMEGATALPLRVSLDPEVLAAAEAAGGFQAAAEQAERQAKEEEERREREQKEEEARQEEASALPKLNIVRSSKFRHIKGAFANRSEFFTNLRPDNSFSSETEVIKCSDRFVAVPWAGSNGQVAVFPLDKPRRFPAAPGLVECGAVQLDLDWNPFAGDVLATGLDDATVKLWKVPEDLLDRTENLTQAECVLRGHKAKVSITRWHPVASNVLATASYDRSVRLWDVGTQQARTSLEAHPEPVVSLAFDGRGERAVSACKDRMLRVLDLRSGQVAACTEGHQGSKPARVTWLGDSQRVLSVGFGRSSERQFRVWDVRSFEQPLATVAIDNLSGVMQPIYDEGCGVVYLAGKGDGTVSYYEVTDEAPYAHLLSKFVTPVPQMGLAVLPRRCVDVRKVQLLRCLKLTTSEVQPLTFSVPRTRREFFQDDLFPPCPSGEAALTAEQFFGGASSEAARSSMQPEGMTPLSQAPLVKRVSKYNFAEEVNKHTSGTSITKEHVMDKFYSKITDSWKEDDFAKEKKKEDDDVDDDEWGDDGWDD